MLTNRVRRYIKEVRDFEWPTATDEAIEQARTDVWFSNWIIRTFGDDVPRGTMLPVININLAARRLLNKYGVNP